MKMSFKIHPTAINWGYVHWYSKYDDNVAELFSNKDRVVFEFPGKYVPLAGRVDYERRRFYVSKDIGKIAKEGQTITVEKVKGTVDRYKITV